MTFEGDGVASRPAPGEQAATLEQVITVVNTIPGAVALDGNDNGDAVFLDVRLYQGVVAGILGVGIDVDEVIDLAAEAGDAVHVDGLVAQPARLNVVVVHFGVAFVGSIFLTGRKKGCHAQQAQHE